MHWNPALSVGDACIDDQHQRLFNLLDDLALSPDESDNKAHLDSALAELREYVARHLRDEEALLRSVRYKDYTAHCAAHREFEDELAHLVERAAVLAPSVALNEIEQFVSCWLVDHIATVDMRYRPFVTG